MYVSSINSHLKEYFDFIKYNVGKDKRNIISRQNIMIEFFCECIIHRSLGHALNMHDIFRKCETHPNVEVLES